MSDREAPSSRFSGRPCGVLSTLLATLLVLAAGARACDCDLPTIEEARAESFSIFSGTVLEAARQGNSFRSARFDVDTVWQGPVRERLHVRTALSEASCGWPFRVGDRMIVYACLIRPDENECERIWLDIETSICTRTDLYSRREAALLGEPRWARPGRAFRRGDLNEDGEVDMTDSVRVLDFLFRAGEAPSCLDILDVNDDGGVDLSDGVYGLNFLFLGGPRPPAPGPTTPGYDPTDDDPFPCGDGPSPLACEQRNESTLPGVRVEILEGPCLLTLAEAAAGVAFTYRAVVDRPLPNVTSVQLATCQQPGPRELLLLPRITGNGQRFCICDAGNCFPEDHLADLVPGSDPAVFAWCGRNWTGPSDFANPVGDPFPPGTYTFEVRGRGTRVDENRVEHQFEIVAEYELQLVE